MRSPGRAHSVVLAKAVLLGGEPHCGLAGTLVRDRRRAQREAHGCRCSVRWGTNRRAHSMGAVGEGRRGSRGPQTRRAWRVPMPVRPPRPSGASSTRCRRPGTTSTPISSRDGVERCVRRYPGCSRVFNLPGALHTHTGWHKRKENISAGVYDRLGHHLKVRATHRSDRTRYRRALIGVLAAHNRRSIAWRMHRGG